MSASHVIGAAVGAVAYTLIGVATFNNVIALNACKSPELRANAAQALIVGATWPLSVVFVGIAFGVFGVTPTCHELIPAWRP